jgi:hypothetical protein
MSIERINNFVIAFDELTSGCDIQNIIAIVNLHVGLLTIYLMFSDKLEKYYFKDDDKTIIKIIKNNLVITIINQAIFMIYLKNIALEYTNLNILRIIISLLYSITQTIFFSVLNDYVVILLNLIFSFSIFMMYFNLDEITALYVNILINSIYISYSLIWKMNIQIKKSNKHQ